MFVPFMGNCKPNIDDKFLDEMTDPAVTVIAYIKEPYKRVNLLIGKKDKEDLVEDNQANLMECGYIYAY